MATWVQSTVWAAPSATVNGATSQLDAAASVMVTLWRSVSPVLVTITRRWMVSPATTLASSARTSAVSDGDVGMASLRSIGGRASPISPGPSPRVAWSP